ncbi:unnamed protein product [Allacma fusca]|uniref:Uncharacterized protein n=1 Tax=Allacma fusca TaxID=39272 RepID=A0A8J2KRG5_9HEXA|nr:unnamed protein product [Allacma fusca]
MQGLLWILVALSTALVGCSASPSFLEGSEADRALGYRKSADPPTPRPTWRPWYNHSRSEIEENMIDRTDPDGFFPDDYYDDYNIEIEGTRRNMETHSTFEERMKSYAKVKVFTQDNAELIKLAQTGMIKTERDRQNKLRNKAARAKPQRSGSGVEQLFSGFGIF